MIFHPVINPKNFSDFMRSIVKSHSQFPQSGETIIALSLRSDTIFNIMKKQLKCPYALDKPERDF